MAAPVLRSRVARRIVLTFVVGAVVPVSIMAVMSFRAVTTQLNDQSRERLDRLAKSAGMAAIERVWWAERALESFAGTGDIEPSGSLPPGVAGFAVIAGDEVLQLRGQVGPVPSLSETALDGLNERAAIRFAGEGADQDLLMAIPGVQPGTVVWGRFDSDSLWARPFAMAELPTTSAICVLDSTASPLGCGMAEGAALAAAFRGHAPARGVERLVLDGEQHLAAGWEIYLPSSFDAEPWWIVISESRARIRAPLRAFAWSFPLALLLGVSVISLLAHVQIRRTLDPLDQLTEGTERIARGELDGRVEVASDDEFADLATSFNTMADQLQGRFRVLAAGRDIDEVALAEFDRDRVVDAFLEGCRAVFGGHRVALIRPSEVGQWRAWASLGYEGDGGRLDYAPVTAHLQGLVESRHSDRTVMADTDALADLDAVGFERRDRPVTLLPLRVSGRVAGVLALGGKDGQPADQDTLSDAHSLVGHTSLGVQSAILVSELEEMSSGAIRAMARAVDAKSPWTAGHSERVTALGVALGREMGLDADTLLLIERGGLLHDVGKIGVPASILDFPGGLSDEQFAVMKRHPVIGVEILEPIPALGPLLPLVRSHHERWDGSGYPDGSAGLEIHPLARLLAVADVFDAMVSERPYRGAMDVDLVHSIIQQDAGVGFDPDVVQALSGVLARGWVHANATLETLEHA